MTISIETFERYSENMILAPRPKLLLRIFRNLDNSRIDEVHELLIYYIISFIVSYDIKRKF